MTRQELAAKIARTAHENGVEPSDLLDALREFLGVADGRYIGVPRLADSLGDVCRRLDRMTRRGTFYTALTTELRRHPDLAADAVPS